jgi:AraC family transcriptional activator of mtrCDE
MLGGRYELPHAQTEIGSAPFHLVLAGCCLIESEHGTSIVAQKGDFILFPRGGRHRIRDLGSDDARRSKGSIRIEQDGLLPVRKNGESEPDIDLLCGHFNYAPGPNELLFKTLPDSLRVSLTGSDSNDVKMSGILQSIVEFMRMEAATARSGALAVVTALSQALFTMALRNYGELNPNQANVLALLSDARLSAAAQSVLRDPSQPWSIEKLGNIASMSRATFARHFREKSGMTVGDFLIEVRMAIACDLLRDTNRSAGDIGMAVGYQSEAAFGKAFRQKVGEMPGRYRRMHRQDAKAT